MGMDIYGSNGNYLRRSGWRWRPLADLCCDLAPDICAACEDWHSNNGDGLDATGATALADVLDAALCNGEVDDYVAKHNAQLAALPDERCRLCRGKGVLSDGDGILRRLLSTFIDMPSTPRPTQPAACNGCGGTGREPSIALHYGLDAENVREFAEFLRTSGGFIIR